MSDFLDLDVFIHKETFFQSADGCIPSHWVVQYWANNPGNFCEAAYFVSHDEAKAFEAELIQYDDWCSSQEEISVNN